MTLATVVIKLFSCNKGLWQSQKENYKLELWQPSPLKRKSLFPLSFLSPIQSWHIESGMEKKVAHNRSWILGWKYIWMCIFYYSNHGDITLYTTNSLALHLVGEAATEYSFWTRQWQWCNKNEIEGREKDQWVDHNLMGDSFSSDHSVPNWTVL